MNRGCGEVRSLGMYDCYASIDPGCTERGKESLEVPSPKHSGKKNIVGSGVSLGFMESWTGSSFVRKVTKATGGKTWD